MRGRVLLVVLGAVAALVVSQSSAGSRSLVLSRSRVHTVARVGDLGAACAWEVGIVTRMAACVTVVQDKDYIAWKSGFF